MEAAMAMRALQEQIAQAQQPMQALQEQRQQDAQTLAGPQSQHHQDAQTSTGLQSIVTAIGFSSGYNIVRTGTQRYHCEISYAKKR